MSSLMSSDNRKRKKSIKSFNKKISPKDVSKEMETREFGGGYKFKQKDVGSMGGRLKGKTRTKTKPGTTKTKTTTSFSASHKGEDPYFKTVKGPKGQKQHFHDIDKRVTRTKVKKKSKGTKVVTDSYTGEKGKTYRTRNVTWK